MKKTIFISALAALAMIGCTEKPENPGTGNPDDGKDDDNDKEEVVLNTVKVSASIESLVAPAAGADIKVAVDGPDFKWQENDSFSLLGTTSDNMKLTLASEAGQAAGTFEGNQDVKTEAGKTYYAAYPYSELSSKEGNGIKGYYGKMQPLAKLNPMMVAKAESTAESLDFEFKNLSTIVRLPVTGNGEKLTGIIFRGNNSEIIAGEYTVTDFENPVPVFAGGEKLIDASAADMDVVLGEEPQIIEFAVPCITYTKGITIRVSTSAGNNNVYTFGSETEPLTFERNTVVTLDAVNIKPVYEWSTGCLTIDENGYRFTDTDKADGKESIGLYFKYNSSVGIDVDIISSVPDKTLPMKVRSVDGNGAYKQDDMLFADIPVKDGSDPCSRVKVADGENNWMMPTEEIWRIWAYKTVSYNAQISFNKSSDRGVYAVFDTDPDPSKDKVNEMYIFESRYLTTSGDIQGKDWQSMWIKSDNDPQYLRFKPSTASNTANPAYVKNEGDKINADFSQAHQIRCCRLVK